MARKTAAAYAAKGNDVYLRESPAFSTLGWFNDPLLSTAVTTDSVDMAALVFHEIAHNTIWVQGAADFNESFAQWAGYRATANYFLARGDTALAIRAGDRWHDEEILGGYYARLLEKLDSLYALKLPAAQNDSGRAAVARWSHDTLAGPLAAVLRTVRVNGRAERPINNAALLGVRLYRTELPLFDRWEARSRGDFALAILSLKELLDGVKGPEAFKRMKAVLHVSAPVTLPDGKDSSSSSRE
jgi:predicted aminopeptidase